MIRAQTTATETISRLKGGGREEIRFRITISVLTTHTT